MFMVHDSVWDSAGYRHSDIACQPCLEKRIGRSLTMDDYRLCPLNFMNVPGFTTDDNLRKLYALDGMDYDKEKAAYFKRCKRLGLKPHWFKLDKDGINTIMDAHLASKSSCRKPRWK